MNRGESMDRSKNNQKILLLITALALVVILTFALTACSLFTDAIKGIFSGNTATVNNTDEGGEADPSSSTQQGASGEAGSGTGSGSEDNAGSGSGSGTGSGSDAGTGSESGSGSSGGSGSSSEPVTPTKSDLVTITSSLVYDKASRTELTIEATHPDMQFDSLQGIGLIGSGEYARVRTVSTKEGSSIVQVDGEYLSSLPAGEYDFYYRVIDNSAEYHHAPFVLTITNTNASPEAKINYDIDCPNVYVTVRCDCGAAHSVTFDGTAYSMTAGADKVKITRSVDKRSSHTATVTCASGKSATITKSSPDAAAYSGGYLSGTYAFMGHTADLYVEDDEEAINLCQYLAYQGAATSLKVYVSSAIYSEIKADASAYLGKLQQELSIPWTLNFGLTCSSGSSEVTFKTEKVRAGSILSSEYTESNAYVANELVSHYSAINQRSKGSELPIDRKTGVAVRNVKELLAAVEAGYRPIATDDALSVYNKAKDFCYTYLSNDMTDLEKLHVIYDYLAGEIDYDYSALNLYSLIGGLSGKSLSDAKSAINAALADDSLGFSDSMKSVIESARDAASTTDDLISSLKDDYLQRLGAFSIEGVFNDGAAVCEGISYSFMLLARIEGIECNQITGYATNGAWVAHAWNKVKLDGKWYCLDATWGNIFMDNKKYVTHRYFMVDESVFLSDHMETIGNYGAGVENLALGDAEYYKSVVVDEAHSLYVKNNADLRAVVEYYVNGDSNYMEFMVDPAYLMTSSDVIAAIRDITGKGCKLSYAAERVFLAYYTLL